MELQPGLPGDYRAEHGAQMTVPWHRGKAGEASGSEWKI